MSYATRCTACGTIFRVVQDQLRVSEGWVRCGRCAEVFDAREQLFDIDRDTPPVWAGDTTVAPSTPLQSSRLESELATEFELPAVEADYSPQSAAPLPAAAGLAAIVDPHARQEPQWVDAAGGDGGVGGAGSAGGVKDGWGVDSTEEPGLGTPDAQATILCPAPSETLVEGLTASTNAAPADSAELPSFMRPLSANSRWRRPAVRKAMAALTLLLLIALTLQLLLHFRDAITANYPEALPGLQALCQTYGCKIQPWRRIEALSVENSALTQLNDASSNGGNATDNRYHLALGLHNKSNLLAATPYIELSLLDINGLVVLRRVLSPTDFRLGRENALAQVAIAPVAIAPVAIVPVAIAPGADVPMQLQLTTGRQRISGYSVEIFHP